MKLRGWLALVLAIGLALGSAALWSSRFVSQRRAAASLRSARAHLTARRFEEARVDLRAAVRLQPDDVEAREQLATLELGVGNWELAFLEFQCITELQPENADGWIGLADLMVKSGLLATPEAALDRAIAAAPRRSDARLIRADIRARVGRYHGARLDREAAGAAAPSSSGLEPAPAPVPAKRLRAEAGSRRDRLAVLAREHWPGRLARMRQGLEIELRQQNWSEADRIVQSARAAYPDTAFAPFLAGIVALARGNPEEAERHLSESLRAAPRSAVIVTALAKAWSLEKGTKFATERLTALAGRDPGFAFARDIAARASMDGRDPVQAETVLRQGLEVQPPTAAAWLHLAEHYLDVDRASDALEILDQGHRRFPNDVELESFLAEVTAGAGRAGDAIALYEDVLSRRPDLDVVEYKLAALLASDENGRASSPRLAELVGRLRGDHPSDPVLLEALGWTLFRSGDAPRGRALLETAVSEAPDEPSAHFHLAQVYARDHKPQRVRTELSAALATKRPFPERLEAMRMLRDSSDASATSQGR